MSRILASRYQAEQEGVGGPSRGEREDGPDREPQGQEDDEGDEFAADPEIEGEVRPEKAGE